MARHVLLVKSHVSAFTRKDGVFVAAHDDKRTKAAITAAQGGDKPVKRVVDSIKQKNKNAAAGLKDTIASDFSKGDISTGDGADMTYGKFNDHLASMRTQLGNDPAHSEHLKHAQFALHQTSGGGGGSSAPIKEKHAKLYGAALSGKTKIDDDGMVRHAPSSTPPANADANEKDWGELDDDDNPTYVMRRLESTHLGHISTGKVDAKRLAHEELANRGLDSNGKWVGFDKAEEHHAALKGKSRPHPSNARVAEHLQSVRSGILSSVAKGHIDMKKRADAELDNRNHDRSGNWIKR